MGDADRRRKAAKKKQLKRESDPNYADNVTRRNEPGRVKAQKRALVRNHLTKQEARRLKLAKQTPGTKLLRKVDKKNKDARDKKRGRPFRIGDLF